VWSRDRTATVEINIIRREIFMFNTPEQTCVNICLYFRSYKKRAGRNDIRITPLFYAILKIHLKHRVLSFHECIS